MPSAGMHHLFARFNGSSWPDAPAAFLLDRLQTTATAVKTRLSDDSEDTEAHAPSSAPPAADAPRLTRAFTCKGPSGIHRFICIGSSRGDVEWLVDITPRGGGAAKLSDDAQAAIALLTGCSDGTPPHPSTLDAPLPPSVFLCEHSGHVMSLQVIPVDAGTLLLTMDAAGCARLWALHDATSDADACAWTALAALEIDDILPSAALPPRSAPQRVHDAYYDAPAQLLFIVTPAAGSGEGEARVVTVPLAITSEGSIEDADIQADVGVCLDTIQLPHASFSLSSGGAMGVQGAFTSRVLYGVENGVWMHTRTGAHTWTRTHAAAGTCSAANAAALAAVMRMAPMEGSPQMRAMQGTASEPASLAVPAAAGAAASPSHAGEDADEDAIVSRAYVCTATWESVAAGATVAAVAVASQACLYAVTTAGGVFTLTYETSDDVYAHDEAQVRVQTLCSCAGVAALIAGLAAQDGSSPHLSMELAVRDMYAYMLLRAAGGACLCIVDIATGALMQCVDMPHDGVTLAASNAHDAHDAFVCFITDAALHAAVPPAPHTHASQLCARLLSSLPAQHEGITRSVIAHALTAYACSVSRMTHTALRHVIAAVAHGHDALTLAQAGVLTSPGAAGASRVLHAVAAVSTAWTHLRGSFPLLAACVHPIQDTIASTDDVSIPAIVHALYACGASRTQIRRALGGESEEDTAVELRVTSGPLTVPSTRSVRGRGRAHSHLSHEQSSDEDGTTKPTSGGGQDVCDDILDGTLPAYSSGASEHTHAARSTLLEYLTAVVAYRRVTLASEAPSAASPVDVAARAHALMDAMTPARTSTSATPMQAACVVTALSDTPSVTVRVQKRLVELAHAHTFATSYEDATSRMQSWMPPECTLTRMREQLNAYSSVDALAAASAPSEEPLQVPESIVHPPASTHTFDVCVRAMAAADVTRVVEQLEASESPSQRGVTPASATAHTSLHTHAAARPHVHTHVPASTHACTVLHNVDAMVSLLRQHTRAVTLLLATGRVQEALDMLAQAEVEDGYNHAPETVPATRSSPTRARSRGDVLTLGQLESRGLLTVPALLQGRIRVRSMARARGAAHSGARGVASPAVTLSALGTAVRWAHTSTRRMAYFHILLMHALRAADVALLTKLWARVPPAYTLPSVLLSLRAAVVTHTADAPSRAADIPASVILPALHVLLEAHYDALDDWARWWKDAHTRPADGVVLRSWGHAALPSGSGAAAGQNTTNSSLTA